MLQALVLTCSAAAAALLLWRRSRARCKARAGNTSTTPVSGEHPHKGIVGELLNHPQPSTVPRQNPLPAPVGEGPLHWINTPTQLRQAAHQLACATQIAVDVEHSVTASYAGRTCLVQLSDGSDDFLIDCIELQDHMHLLRPLFADSCILKVVHGGENDVVWLQQDFGIFFVNMFDTEKACQVLGRQQRSLGHLLQRYCGIATDKSLQRADWCTRPLPEHMLLYARKDVHYLLYIAGQLAAELWSEVSMSNGHLASPLPPALQQACQKSQALCLRQYTAPNAEAAVQDAAASLFRRTQHRQGASASTSEHDANATGSSFDGALVYNCVAALCHWRDTCAQQLDRGVQSVLPDDALLSLAEQRPSSPADVEQLLRSELASSGRTGDLKFTARQVCFMLAEAAEAVDPWQGKQRPQQVGADAGGGRGAGRQGSAARQLALRERRVQKFSARSPVYQNCKMLSQQGELLCFSDRKKLDWYVARGLADLVDQEPPTIRLRFPHKTGDQLAAQDVFYHTSKHNRCVVCGEEGHYLRYRVVPSCYRRHFPVFLKAHRSHDIVLLCVDCHERAHQSAERLKRQISKEFGVPMLPPRVTKAALAESNQQEPMLPDLSSVRSAGVALTKHGGNLPADRREELESVVRLHVGKSPQDALAQVDLQLALTAGLGKRMRKKVLQQQLPTDNADEQANDPDSTAGAAFAYTSQDRTQANGHFPEDEMMDVGHFWHGRQVVGLAMERDEEQGVLSLMQRFRQNFVDALHPAFLPSSWHIAHQAPREFGAFSIYNQRGEMLGVRPSLEEQPAPAEVCEE